MDKMTEEKVRNMNWVGGYAEKLLRVARATLEYYQIKAVSAGGEPDNWDYYAPPMIVEALKEVEHLLDE